MKSASLISAEQIRAARALLDWSRDKLAAKSGVSVRTLVMIEGKQGKPRLATFQRIHDALVRAGISFIKENGGEGARLTIIKRH